MFKKKWIGLILVLVMVVGLVPGPSVQAAVSVQDLRQYFDSVDTKNNGDWYKNYNNEHNDLAYGESFVMQAYLAMFEATGDTYYLDKFVDHAKGVLAQRDSVRGVTDHRGLSLPAWSSSHYTDDGSRVIYPIHTGMIAQPLAKFGAIVNHRPELASYRDEAAEFVQAAKDALAVFDANWYEDDKIAYLKGSGGYHKPFNMTLAQGDVMVNIYRATGETAYRDKAAKVARYFRGYLQLDSSTNSYLWKYSMKYSVWEDLGHAIPDLSFVYHAYLAGIEFNETDMQRFANTVAKKLIRPDGTIARRVDGSGNYSPESYISLFLWYDPWAPAIFDASAQRLLNRRYVNAAELEGVALLARAQAIRVGTFGQAVVPQPQPQPQPEPQPPAATKPDGSSGQELIVNGTFDAGRSGWLGSYGSVETDPDGNRYAVNDRNFGFSQKVQVKPGTDYRLQLDIRRGTASDKAQILVIYYDAAGNKLDNYSSFTYQPQGKDWETVKNVLSLPGNVHFVRVYLMGGNGTFHFDNVSLQEVLPGSETAHQEPGQDAGQPQQPEPDVLAPWVDLVLPEEGSYVGGTVGLRASARDNQGLERVYFAYTTDLNRPWVTLGDGNLVEGTDQDGSWELAWQAAELPEGELYLRAVALDQAGNVEISSPVTVKVDTTAPTVELLNPVTQELVAGNEINIRYRLSEAAKVNVTVYDEGGQAVAHLLEAFQEAGEYQIAWDGKVNGTIIPGSYTYAIAAQDPAGNQGKADGTIKVVEPNLIVNGDFSHDRTGWVGSYGTIEQEAGGNKYLANSYNFGFSQWVNVEPGTEYILSAKIRKGDATKPAKILVLFYNESGKSGAKAFTYEPAGNDWEQVEYTISVPNDVIKIRIYLMTSGGSGNHHFDDVNLKPVR
ncbi:carbohydrate binding domain-containing protein [Calderihabitans maritimus]|uniref:Uncharacterized protein n=1 Tax=Calderihabitans maritimus TaxID=1246530 RepID=A0A1Z5HP85_9FIRM|nr:carbohydrate binding domain-containing protein [Calderihabitans maritimus]GAW91342.1 hypothetical protein PTH_1110 [Calderihabitans maritimus]